MRIALATDWYAPRRGGIETQLQELARRLAAQGHAVDIITATPGPDVDGAVRRRFVGALVPFTDLAFGPALLPAMYGALAHEYDVVHAHVSVMSPVGYTAALVARSLGLPVVITFHSVLRLKRIVLAAANTIVGANRNAVVWTAVSGLVGSQVTRATGVDVPILPNGIDLAAWRGRERAGAPPRTPIFASTMRLHRKKRPRQLVRAFAQAFGSGQPARLLLIGDGPERPLIERDIDALGLRAGNATVELRGWLDPERLREVYADSTAFIQPSLRESFGIAALEAAAAGLPVIAMRGSGSEEFLSHGVNALLCDDDADLARMLRSSAAMQLAPDHDRLAPYDWSNVIARHHRIYEQAIQRTRDVAGTA